MKKENENRVQGYGTKASGAIGRFAPVLMLLFLAAITFSRLDGLALAPLLLLMGFVALSVTPVIMALVQESAPENRALANGIYMLIVESDLGVYTSRLIIRK